MTINNEFLKRVLGSKAAIFEDAEKEKQKARNTLVEVVGEYLASDLPDDHKLFYIGAAYTMMNQKIELIERAAIKEVAKYESENI